MSRSDEPSTSPASSGTVSTIAELDLPPENQEIRRTMVRGVLSNLFLLIFGLLFLAPMMWLIFASLDSKASWSIEWPHFTLSNFRHALAPTLLHSLANSLELALVATVVGTCSAVLAAYSLSRRAIPFKGPFLLFIIFTSGVPLTILIIPIFEIYARYGLLSIVPTAIFLAVTSLPFQIYLMKNFIDAVPVDLEEAARLERANTFQILRRVVVPLALPGIAAAAIFGFVNAWGSFLVPLILISSSNQQPGPVTIYSFIGSNVIQYGDIAAYSIVFCIPVFILYAISSRLFRKGFVLGGAVKG